MKFSRNPNWTTDEVIVALNFYFDLENNKIPSKGSTEIMELSFTMRKLATKIGHPGTNSLRNPSGIHGTFYNLQAIEEHRRSDVPLGKTIIKLWEHYKADKPALKKLANAIISHLDADYPITTEITELDTTVEGRLLTGTHLYRERDNKIVAYKKNQVYEKLGRLECEACSFNFAEKYGERGQGFIECHHLTPLSELKTESKTELNDLTLLCSNCHRMVHRVQPWLDMKALSASLR